MIYLTIKAIHIFAAILWVGSFVLVCFITASSKMSQEQMKIAVRLTDAGIGLTWLAGVVLVVMGSWYASTWWQIKIVLVVVISAIHTIMHRRWKQASSEGASTHPVVWRMLLSLAFLVVLLAVFKRPI